MATIGSAHQGYGRDSRRVTVLAGILLAWSASWCVAAQPEPWIEDSFEDFADGRLDAAGQNLYVSRNGAVRAIHRFDLNQDGFIDLVFNSTHDTITDLPATQAAFGTDGGLESRTLPVGGSLNVALGDLNRDGFTDAAFCPNRGGVQQSRQFVTIAWGSAGGWRADRLARLLPVNAARRIAIADLNVDDWPDIVVLNGPAWQHGQPDGDIVRVYWGAPGGFLLTRRADFGVDAALDLVAGDFDRDGAAEIAVLHRFSVEVLWADLGADQSSTPQRTSVELPDVDPKCLVPLDREGHADLLIGAGRGDLLRTTVLAGRSFGEVTRSEAVAATHISSGDLDADGRPDLVVTNFESGRAAGGEAAAADPLADQALLVLWGADDGYAVHRATPIPLANVAATVVGDLNADGQADIAAAVYQGTETFAADSAVLLGRPQRKFVRATGELPTVGASGVAIAPAEGDLPARALFCSSVGGTLREEVPLQLYWGGRDGFDRNRVTEVPFASGYESTAADFNLDGHVDLVELNSGHSGAISLRDPTLGINIFWGSADGFDFNNRRTVLREENLGTSNTADLNRDGYLDLVAGQFSASTGQTETQLIVYYGGADGFSTERRAAVDSPGRSIGTVIADFNNDDWLDVAVAAMTAECVRIFWGSEAMFHVKRSSEVPLHSAIDLETADFNADGWSDLVVGCYADGVTHEHDLGSHILWGSAAGFHQSNSQWLPGLTPIGHCVADFDADGHLDLFSPHYHGNGIRESLPCYLFWGSADGFDPARRTELTCDSADDALAADFDQDGQLDLAVVNHARDGAHHTVSRVFFNDGARFAAPRVQTLPTHGPHWMWQEDMGHIQHRRREQRYESSVHAIQDECCAGRIEVQADAPDGTRLELRIRAAASAELLPMTPWRIVTDRFSLERTDRAIQYAAVFHSQNGDAFPLLDRVVIHFE